MINFEKVKTPCYIVDEKLLIRNLEILQDIRKSTGAKILLAQKAFSMFYFYPLMSKYLDGTAASSLYEAKLGHEHFAGETHIISAAYRSDEFEEITRIADSVIFNSFNQWNLYKDAIKKSKRKISCGLRINPEYSEIQTELYNPCAANSRLGIKLEDFEGQSLDGIDGLHFHTLCEQNSDTLKRTLEVVDKKFGFLLNRMKWINFGGGHHITREDYDIKTLKECINFIKSKYDIEVYLEPGEAVALNCGFLATRVLEMIKNKNGYDNAITDASAACHMPDVLEMPYIPKITGAKEAGVLKHTYRLGGQTCLAGDIIGDYSFDKPLNVGDILTFHDMAHYTMVKNNTFNGIGLPDILVLKDNSLITVKTFGYEDFKNRLS